MRRGGRAAALILLIPLFFLFLWWQSREEVPRPEGGGAPSPEPLARSTQPRAPSAPKTSEEREATAPPPALRRVCAAAPAPDPDPCNAGIRWIPRRQSPDGSWGEEGATLEGDPLGKPGVTALALLALLGAGYSHLSRDHYDEKSAGAAVSSGLFWLMVNRREDGTFFSGRGPLDQALGALAFAEAYGWVGSPLFEGPAQDMLGTLVRLQAPDGSWGSPVSSAWAAQALASARQSGLEVPASSWEGLRAYYDTLGAPDAREVVARLRLDGSKDHPAVIRAAWRIPASPPGPDYPSIHELYFGTAALFLFEGTSSSSWKAWGTPLESVLRQRRNSDGAWPGATPTEAVVNTALALLCAQVYYGYAHAIGAR